MKRKEYNGWTNYETWSVALLIDNDQGSQEYWQERAEEAVQEAIDNDESEIKHKAACRLAELIQEEHEENNPLADKTDIYSQLLSGALSEVNWYEIAKSRVDEIKLFSAGWNMPGYMPDSDPACFTDFESARDYILEEIKRAADEKAQETDYQEHENHDGEENTLAEYDDAKECVEKQASAFSLIVGDYVYWIAEE